MINQNRTFALMATAFVIGAAVAASILGARSQAAISAVAPSATEMQFLMQKPLWFYVTTTIKTPTSEQITAHLNHQVDLEKRGIMFAAGPVTDVNGKAEYGLVVVRAQSAEEAKHIADSDPMHINGLRTYTLHQWNLHEGHIDFGIDFHDSHVTAK